MSYAGIERPPQEHLHSHCGDREPHAQHSWGKIWGYDTAKICTGQLTCDHTRDERYDGLS